MSNAIEGKFKIDNHEFTEALTDVNSEEYKKLAKDLESEVSINGDLIIASASFSSSSRLYRSLP